MVYRIHDEMVLRNRTMKLIKHRSIERGDGKHQLLIGDYRVLVYVHRGCIR